VNRGAPTSFPLSGVRFRPGRHPNLLAGTSPPNTQSKVRVAGDGTVTVSLAHLGAIVAR
jgi:hypothetical protein